MGIFFVDGQKVDHHLAFYRETLRLYHNHGNAAIVTATQGQTFFPSIISQVAGTPPLMAGNGTSSFLGSPKGQDVLHLVMPSTRLLK